MSAIIYIYTHTHTHTSLNIFFSFFTCRVAIFTCECKKHVSASEALSSKYVSHKWIKKIENDRLLSAISIPGTHQSNRYLKTSKPMFQAWGLHNQLDAGVRFFDLHVSSDSIKYVKTGSVQESETLNYFLKTMWTFLVKQKKEILLLRVTPDEGAVAQVTKLLSRDNWPVWRDKVIPTLGQVRGKIVLIQSSTLELGLPVHITELNADMDTKETQMRENIKKASQKCEQEMMLTYTVANGESEPLKIAKTLNKQVDNYLLNLKGDKNRPHCVGIIAMDFPGPKVIQTIINFNGKLGEGTQIVGEFKFTDVEREVMFAQ
uniref:Phosphatidylinositol-specific phospholipase C X domain-containing protein n=1 Tax=Sinocyclocheilus anshuiensis TaxID=1608454 RepID=A0A671KGI8_9TELE